jgi:hypothetical protein
MKKVFSRGFNFHGQCGLGSDVQYSLEKFSEIKNIPSNVSKVCTNLGHSFALLNGINFLNFH